MKTKRPLGGGERLFVSVLSKFELCLSSRKSFRVPKLRGKFKPHFSSTHSLGLQQVDDPLVVQAQRRKPGVMPGDPRCCLGAFPANFLRSNSRNVATQTRVGKKNAAREFARIFVALPPRTWHQSGYRTGLPEYERSHACCLVKLGVTRLS